MFKRGLFKTIIQKVDQLFTGRGRIDEELFEELEEMLIASDLNVHTTMRMMEELRRAVQDERLKESVEVIDRLKAFLTGILLAGVPAPAAVPAPSAAAVAVAVEPVPLVEAPSEHVPATAVAKFKSWFSRLAGSTAAAAATTTVVTPQVASEPEPPAEPTAGVATALAASPAPPTVYLVVGVNGVGKTTTIAKLAFALKREGHKVVLAAADTFRAAAVEQLALWGERVGVDVIKGREGADPASVVFDSIQAARARGADYLIVDTAGRLHNKANLMEELKKINRVLIRACDGRPADETLLVLDATTGQNAISQAKVFKDAVDVTGLVLAKLDGTARGGIVVTIKDELKIPIKLIGTGEKPGDLEPFDAHAFVDALFE
ncbi:MAG: signal recognition particle-docking protein FtsY [Capsulimonadaceae bacterium]